MVKLKSYKAILNSCQLQVLLTVIYFNWYLLFTWLQSKLTSILTLINFACTSISNLELDLLTVLNEAEKKLLNWLNVLNFIDCILKVFKLSNSLSFLSNISRDARDFLSTGVKDLFTLIRDKVGSDHILIKVEKEFCINSLQYGTIDNIISFFVYIFSVVNYILLGLMLLTMLYNFIDWNSSHKNIIKTRLIHLYLPRYTLIITLIFIANYYIFFYFLNWIQSNITKWITELINIGLDAILLILKQGKSYIQGLNLVFCELNLSDDVERVIHQIVTIFEIVKGYSNIENISLFSDIAMFNWNIMISLIALSSFWIVTELTLIFHSKLFTKAKSLNHLESDISLDPFNNPRYIIK